MHFQRISDRNTSFIHRYDSIMPWLDLRYHRNLFIFVNSERDAVGQFTSDLFYRLEMLYHVFSSTCFWKILCQRSWHQEHNFWKFWKVYISYRTGISSQDRPAIRWKDDNESDAKTLPEIGERLSGETEV